MLLQPAFLLIGALSTLTTALPLTSRTTLTASTIEAIDPTTSSCAGADAPSECADASTAAPAISASFTKYQITSVGEQVALLSIMLYETGGFKYKINHHPGTPGQGTRNMQYPTYNLKYATALYPDEVAAAQAQGVVAVLDLVNTKDEDSFGSAAWFLSTQCSDSIRQGLATGSQAGWQAYLTQCVGTTDTSDRDVIWTAATKIMAGSS